MNSLLTVSDYFRSEVNGDNQDRSQRILKENIIAFILSWQSYVISKTVGSGFKFQCPCQKRRVAKYGKSIIESVGAKIRRPRAANGRPYIRKM